jgi:hypothetical protein
MNAVEIEEAIAALAEQPFDAAKLPFALLQAFGNKETTIKRLRKGESNKSDLDGVPQTNNIHIAVAAPGEVTKTLAAPKAKRQWALGYLCYAATGCAAILKCLERSYELKGVHSVS